MADIRESFNDSVGMGARAANSPLERARATSSDRMSDKIATEGRFLEHCKEVIKEAEALSLPVWAVNMRNHVNIKGTLVLSVKNNGDLYYRDHLNCKVELPSSAKSSAVKDGMLLLDFLKLVA